MNNEEQNIQNVLRALRDPRTIRVQSQRILNFAKQDQLKHFSFNPKNMEATASYIIEVITHRYPDLNIPYHSRWRHFEVDSIDRISNLRKQLGPTSPTAWGKILYELVIISVLLDAGAGPLWHYTDSVTRKEYSRSEGLALATLSLYESGAFSADPKNPFRVDAERLLAFKEKELIKGFQVTSSNLLEGIPGRVSLLNRLGAIIHSNRQYFNNKERLGEFYSYIESLQSNNALSAIQLFKSTLDAFNDIWPVRLLYHGVSLGDVWIHSALKTEEPGSEYIPFHKLSQWLTYSLVEPLEQAGISITDLNALTSLPEYRNGGLLIDTELLTVKNREILQQPQDPGSEAIVEWRALTVALLDELAVLIRQKLNRDVDSLPLAKILQGGTWEAGRRIAQQKRITGTPPIEIISDGTVF
ncbi:uracil phosphoribosyltransferase [Legionella norrlandica]|uniref:Uracil phosphoribosyltransferase n=1 Tax=Legionella norrlandica TaxID=1498499 RepID=A0A0A2SSA3_9GAMM|nr:URC4/urg3 family protein [Legionella norrlandica]KGP63980.1 uracil phosphoribosyltransferase [Legionella norrlandica]